MSKFTISIQAGDTAMGAFGIQPGESIEADIVWRNSDGSARTPGTITLKVYGMPEKKLVLSTSLSPATTLSIAGATTAAWTTRKAYHGELWETAGDGSIQSGHFQINVGD